MRPKTKNQVTTLDGEEIKVAPVSGKVATIEVCHHHHHCDHDNFHADMMIIIKVILDTDTTIVARLPKRTVPVLSFVFDLETGAELRSLETRPSLLLLLPSRMSNRCLS